MGFVRKNVLDSTEWDAGRGRLAWRRAKRRGVVRKHVGYGKRVAGKSLDLTVTLVIGNRIWVMMGVLNLFGHI